MRQGLRHLAGGGQAQRLIQFRLAAVQPFFGKLPHRYRHPQEQAGDTQAQHQQLEFQYRRVVMPAPLQRADQAELGCRQGQGHADDAMPGGRSRPWAGRADRRTRIPR